MFAGSNPVLNLRTKFASNRGGRENIEVLLAISTLVAITAVAARLLPVLPGVIVFGLVMTVLAFVPRRSARSLRRPLHLKRQVEGLRRTALYDADLGVYQGWYFDLRLKEEAARCQRYGLSMAVIVVKILLGEDDHSDASWRVKAAEAAYSTSRGIRTVDLCASTGPLEFSVLLVHCNEDGADVVGGRLAAELKDYGCLIGRAVFPTMETNVDALLERARGDAKRWEGPRREAA